MDKEKFIFALTFIVCLAFTLGSIRLTLNPGIETAVVIAGEPEVNSPDDIRELTLAGHTSYDIRK
tara:strand:- start:1246 stop:1440 length:195 start_codon:yes stop_codon:yes gene_type:complete